MCNDVLSYTSCARDNIVPNCIGYYNCDERFINRKVCASKPNPCVAHYLAKKEGENSHFSMFLASGFNMLPPNGFEPITYVISSLRLCALN